jgi:glutamate dehydrogenase
LVEHEVDRLFKLGAPHAQAEQPSQLLYAYTFLDIVDIASTINRSVTQVADVYFGLGERLGVDTLLAAVAELPRRDRWEALARRSLRDHVFATLRAATNDLFILSQDFPGTDPSVRRWAEARAARLAAVDSIRDEILTGAPPLDSQRSVS